MFIEQSYRGYNSSGEQVVQRAKFLLFLQPDVKRGTDYHIRCLVRKVAMRQCGHWMMGAANLGGKWYTVSGSYGNDGLPMDVPMSIWEKGIKLPIELYQAWNIGEGHNGAGNEATLVRQWAIETF